MFDVFYTKHALQRMFERSISYEEVQRAILEGEIIKEYPEDKPYPSLLFLLNNNYKPLHVVCSIEKNENNMIKYFVITAYRPSLEEWDNNYRTRKGDK